MMGYGAVDDFVRLIPAPLCLRLRLVEKDAVVIGHVERLQIEFLDEVEDARWPLNQEFPAHFYPAHELSDSAVVS